MDRIESLNIDSRAVSDSTPLGNEFLYLDHAATTPLSEVALAAMLQVWREGPANPSSQHRFGRRAASRMRQSREAMLRMLDARVDSYPADRLVFTGGGTESNHLALAGLARFPSGNLVISSLEHPSVRRMAESLQARGYSLRVVPPDDQGRVSSESVAEVLDDQTALVSVMTASNETGVIQPIAQIAQRCRELGIPMHTDAVQAVGKIPLSMRDLGVSAMTIAAHKFHGPVGIGALAITSDRELVPQTFGGFQEQGRRAGTEAVALIAGMEAALREALEMREQVAVRMQETRDTFERILLAELEGLSIVSSKTTRLPHISCLVIPGIERQAFVMAADLYGIACSSGSACASGSSEPSLALASMGLSSAELGSAVRFAFGRESGPSEAVIAAERILKIVKNLRRLSSR